MAQETGATANATDAQLRDRATHTGTLAAENVVHIGTVTTVCTLSLTGGTILAATLTASTPCVFTPPPAEEGRSFLLLLSQAAATGNGTATFPGIDFGAAGAPVITPTPGKMDMITGVSNGVKWFGTYVQGFTA